MQIKIQIKLNSPLCIPFNYNHQLQSVIYRKLSEVGASVFWHDGGFGDECSFKAFVMGPLCGKYIVKDNKLIFNDTVCFEVRSPVYEFCDSLQRSFEIYPKIKLFDSELEVSGITVSNIHINKSKAVFEAQSPVVVRSKQPEETTVYHAPNDEKFVNGIITNFKKKYEAICCTSAGEISITPLGEHRKVVTNYKGIWITGYTGRYEATGSRESLEFLYNTGMGIKNSQGFGLLNIMR